MLARTIRSTGVEKETVAGCGATSMNGSRWMGACRQSISIGTKLTLTAVGLPGGYLRKWSGNLRPVQSQRKKIEVLRFTNEGTPGVTIYPLRNAQILIGA